MRRTIASLLVLAASLAPAAYAAGPKVVVNAANPGGSMSRTEVSALFLKKTTHWADGSPVVAVDQVDSSAVHTEFCELIHRKNAAAIRSFWQQQIFSGRDVPPVEKKNDGEVLDYVRANRGAVGYVSESASTSGVKVVEVH
jgi:ABC-type phosphate transport system substrate-binding protein